MKREKYTQRRRTTTVNVVQTRIESIKRSDIRRTGVRVFDGACIGVAGALGSYIDADLETRAKAALDRGVSYPWELSGDRAEKVAVTADIPDETEFVDEMEHILRELRKRHPELIFSNNGKLVESLVAIENDCGLDLEYSTRNLSIGLGFKHLDSGGIMDGFTGFSTFDYARKKALEDLCRPCEAFGRMVDLPRTGRMPVIFSSEDPLMLRKLRGDLNGHQFGSGSSLLAGRIGEKLFSSCFSLTQTADHLIRPFPFFDAEGVVNDGYRVPLVEEGIFRSVYTDRRTADRFTLPHTGSAGAVYDAVPSLYPASLRIEATGQTMKELLAGEPGILVVFAMGGDFTPGGDFATPVQLSYLHDGEEFLGRLPELRISSNVFSMFGEDFSGCSTDSLSSLSEDRCVVSVMEVEKTG